MWKLSIPKKYKFIEDLELALTYKNGDYIHELTTEEKKEVRRIYKAYHQNEGIANDALLSDKLSLEVQQLIHDAYGEVQIKKRLQSLRERLLNSTDECPCCGLLPADELDHHLPRFKYKVIAVYIRNIVPLCHKCNNKKRTVTGENEKERFIHAYYERLPVDEQFLTAELKFQDTWLVTSFQVVKTPSLTELQVTQMNFQLNRVGFETRVGKAINKLIIDLAVSIENAFGADNNNKNLSLFLHHCHLRYQKDFGLNNWQTVFLLELSKNDEFCSGGFKNVLQNRKRQGV